jgi:AAA+ ATPase superfamily predicted ATPase
MSGIIGRNTELKYLETAQNSAKSELVVVYGRRRVGKTFLIREFFKSDLIFELTGLFNGNLTDQLENFTKELLIKSNQKTIQTPKKWLDAFTLLEGYINSKRSKKKKVIFIDEFPWIATPKSNFLMAFENFWNHFVSKRDDLIVVVCGSAASYMSKNIIQNKGGLHNRITLKIRLLPFNLKETDLFLKSRGIKFTQYDVAQIYMAIGGVPHYLEKIQKGNSVAQTIDSLCFSKEGLLREEFNQLFSSLFDDSEKHIRIIKTLSKSNKGIPRKILVEKSGISSGGDFSLKLTELIESGFVSEYSFYKNKKQLTLFRLSDEYSMFYLKFIENNKNVGEGTWQRLAKSQSYISWSGFSFETLCLKHIQQIKRGLKIEGIYSTSSSWFNDNAQIDLIIDRDDNVINLCEIKFHSSSFVIDRKYYLNIKNKIAEFEHGLARNKNVFFTLVLASDFKENEYSRELIDSVLNLKIFFD